MNDKVAMRGGLVVDTVSMDVQGMSVKVVSWVSLWEVLCTVGCVVV